MSPNELPGAATREQDSADVEEQLQQLRLRKPSDQLDVAIAKILESGDARSVGSVNSGQRFVLRGRQFGWTAILTTAAAAMFAGLWLGHHFTPNGEKHQDSHLAAVDLKPTNTNTNQLTPVSFNVDAFNLLHGHSQQEEFENCDQCHHQPDVADDLLTEIFESWFYGDDNFFEAHSNGVDACSKCHIVEDKKPKEFGEKMDHGFMKLDKLANCSDCHKVDAEGFSGFKKDWHSSSSSSDG